MRSRRQVLRLAAGAVLLPVLSRNALAQAYPIRSVRVIVAVSPGGTTDLAARVMAQWLTKRLGQPFVVENRAGGATNIGTEAAVRSPPDGYTLFMANSSNAVNETLYPDIGFKFSADLVPVAISIRSPLAMLVNPSVPAKTTAEFIALAKADPSKINMGSGGKGATGHVAGELFQMMAGVKFQHIPYRGEAPAMTDLIGGQVQLVFATTGSSLPYVKAGKLRALAVTTATRAKDLPDVPPLGDVLPGYEASSWSGFTAPKNTPADIIDKLNRDLNTATADPEVQARFADLGAPAVAASPAEFGQIIAGDVAKWAKVIKAAGLTGD
jgi:tripartite-type tricarboxylate transporter receptor subunit TctC